MGNNKPKPRSAAQVSVDPDVARSAALTLCDRATDATDARLLLEACGLVAYTPGKPQTYSYGRRS